MATCVHSVHVLHWHTFQFPCCTALYSESANKQKNPRSWKATKPKQLQMLLKSANLFHVHLKFPWGYHCHRHQKQRLIHSTRRDTIPTKPQLVFGTKEFNIYHNKGFRLLSDQRGQCKQSSFLMPFAHSPFSSSGIWKFYPPRGRNICIQKHLHCKWKSGPSFRKYWNTTSLCVVLLELQDILLLSPGVLAISYRNLLSSFLLLFTAFKSLARFTQDTFYWSYSLLVNMLGYCRICNVSWVRKWDGTQQDQSAKPCAVNKRYWKVFSDNAEEKFLILVFLVVFFFKSKSQARQTITRKEVNLGITKRITCQTSGQIPPRLSIETTLIPRGVWEHHLNAALSGATKYQYHS